MIRARFRTDLSGLDKLEKNLPRRIKAANEKFAEAIINDIKKHWSPVSPSAYGSPPAKVTGTLEESLKAGPSDRDPKGRFATEDTWYKIEAQAPYASALEDQSYYNRQFLEPAMRRMQSQTKIIYKRILSARGT